MSLGESFRTVSDLSDTVSALLVSPSDSTLLLTVDHNSNEFFPPTVKVKAEESWSGRLQREIIREIFGTEIEINRLLSLRKFWIPHHKYLHLFHAIFEINVNEELKKKSKSVFGKTKHRLVWISEDELQKSAFRLKSPELRQFFDMSISINNFPVDYYIIDNFIEICDSVLIPATRNAPFDIMMNAVNINRLMLEILYREYLWMTYPCLLMSLQAFTKFLHSTGWSQSHDLQDLYRTADYSNYGGVTFQDFACFVAACDPSVNFSGSAAEIRCRYVFRYLDRDGDNQLDKSDIKRFVVMARKVKKVSIDDSNVDIEVAALYINNSWQNDRKLTQQEFLRAVGELKLRGTSQILKGPISVQKYVKECLEKDILLKESLSSIQNYDNISSTSNLLSKAYTKTNSYNLASHVIHLTKNGGEKSIKELLSHELAISESSQAAPILNEISRRSSRIAFGDQSTANELLRSVRYLSDINDKTKVYREVTEHNYTWGHIDPENYAKNLVTICVKVKEIFMKELRMLDLTTPIYILGDLHGNFPDLLNFEKTLWQLGPDLCPSNILLLGDYVDRGAYGVEIISYLFAYKTKVPKKLFMIRGNHELRRVQAKWTFERECLVKFGSKFGNTVFRAINDALDAMPLAAVIDGRIFCCHGGIPPSWLCPLATSINDLPINLTDPEQIALAWDLMWNDPIESQDLTEKITLELLANEGFALNPKRGTGHVFNSEALDKFLRLNGFTHVIRAHEPADEGFNIKLKGKLITVFSSSNYCGGENSAACIFADQGKLRIIKIR